jgi:hypothetical protein
MRYDMPGYIYERSRGRLFRIRRFHMNTLAALLARIEYLSAENRELACRLDYALKQQAPNKPKPAPKRPAKRG